MIYRKRTLRLESRDLVDFLRRSTSVPVARPYEIRLEQVLILDLCSLIFVVLSLISAQLVPRRFDPPLALTRIYTLAGEISWATLAIDEKYVSLRLDYKLQSAKIKDQTTDDTCPCR